MNTPIPPTDPAPPCEHVLKRDWQIAPRIDEFDGYICERCDAHVDGVHVLKMLSTLADPLCATTPAGKVDEVQMRMRRAEMLRRSGILYAADFERVRTELLSHLSKPSPAQPSGPPTPTDMRHLEEVLLNNLREKFADPNEAMQLLARVVARTILDHSVDPTLTRGLFFKAVDAALGKSETTPAPAIDPEAN